jgi:hypothetical protein
LPRVAWSSLLGIGCIVNEEAQLARRYDVVIPVDETLTVPRMEVVDGPSRPITGIVRRGVGAPLGAQRAEPTRLERSSHGHRTAMVRVRGRRLLMVVALMLSVGGCRCLSLNFVGMACDDRHPCPGNLRCEGGECSEGGGDAGTCPLDVDPAVSQCAGVTWYLSPSGDAGADGLSPDSPLVTLDQLTALAKGDRVVLLPGVYQRSMTLTRSGTAACPILISGPEDGGAVLEAKLSLEARSIVLRGLEFAGHGTDDVWIIRSSHIIFDKVRFHSRAPNQSPRNINSGCCAECAVLDSTFESTAGISAVLVQGTECPGFVFRGNHVVLDDGVDLGFSTAGGVIEGNEFTGHFNSDVIAFSNQAAGVVRRNVFHDIEAGNPDKRLIRGAALVESNTFSEINGNQVPLVLTERFSNNLVTYATPTVGLPMGDGGGYNLFDPSVTKPWTDSTPSQLVSGTDRVAAVTFESQTSFGPAAQSQAIDSADPSLPVPPGGGPRADVGALERGATMAHGRYCMLDGGEG